ncbi:MAG TPA: hypothetical protein VIT45_05595 [Allosphingosinicella sp.]
MSVAAIDGTLEAANLKRRVRNISVYDSITIRRDGGGEERLGKTIVSNPVADALEPGTRGRFYTYASIDHKGLHGVRTADKAVYDFPRNNEKLMLVVLAVNLVWLVGGILYDGRARYLPLALVVLAAVVYPLYRKTRVETQRQFEADASAAIPA